MKIEILDNGNTLRIKCGRKVVLEIQEFADPSHPGTHLFLIPLSGSMISESAEGGWDWTHELLRG